MINKPKFKKFECKGEKGRQIFFVLTYLLCYFKGKFLVLLKKAVLIAPAVTPDTETRYL